MAQRRYGVQSDQQFRGRSKFSGRIAGSSGDAPADGLVNAAAHGGIVMTLGASATLNLPHGGILLFDNVGANRLYQIPAPGVVGRTITAILTYATALPAGRTCRLQAPTTGYFKGALSAPSRAGNILAAGSGNSLLGFQGGSAAARANQGDWIQLIDTGEHWVIRGWSDGSEPFWLS